MRETGIVEKIKDSKMIIKIEGEGAGSCEKCGIKGICSSQAEKRFIELTARAGFEEGAKVCVEINEGYSIFIAFLLFIAPLLVFLGAFVLLRLFISEGLSIASGLAAGALYFFIISRLEKRLVKKVNITRL